MKYTLLVITLLITQYTFAQTYTISGRIIEKSDTSGLIGVGIIATSLTDTSQKSGTATDDAGNFTLTNLKPGNYTISTSYIGYNQLSRTTNVTGDINLGNIVLEASPTTLNNVTVQGTQTRVQQLGDTTQFNASAYKTNPDANVEDLVTKMPGVTSENGALKVNGEDVKRVMVDGKMFFGDDASTAVKNLPAEVVDKVQVFDRMSDQSQFTGFDDGQGEKTINIVTKPGKNNGQFGKVYAGYGTDDRYIAGGNINFFNGARRISVIGLSNNINQQNFSTDDLLGVTGSNSGQNRGGGMPGGGGAGGGGNRGGGGRGYGGGGSAGNFLVGQQGGITKTNAIGLNYSDDWGKKIKATGSYFFNQTDNENNTTLSRRYSSGGDSAITYKETSQSIAKNINHRANLRLEYNIDSSNSIIYSPSVSIQNNEANKILTAQNLIGNGTTLLSSTNSRSASNNFGYNFNNSLLYRHKFKKQGRTISLNLAGGINNRDGNSSLYSFNDYEDSDSLVDQRSNNYTHGYNMSGNITYTEPLSKLSQLMVNYNPSFTSGNTDRETFNIDSNSSAYTGLDTLLSNKYKNTYTTHNGGLSYNLIDKAKKMNLMLSVNGQYATLEGDQEFPRAFQLEKNFTSILPRAMFNYRFSKTENIRIFYRTSNNAPSISQLQDVIDNSNPLLLKTGNPDLKQDYQNTFMVRYGNTNTKTSRSFFAFAFANFTNNYIGNATIIPGQDTTVENGVLINRGGQLTKPVNLDGYVNARTFLTYGLPINPIKSNLNLNAGFSYGHTPAMINNIVNYSNTYNVNGGFTLGSNISPNVDFAVSYSGNYNIARNTVQTELDNKYYSQITSLKFNWIFLKGFVFNTNINHNLYTGLTSDFSQSFLLWNASFGYKFLKNRALEAKVVAYDILNQNSSISQTSTDTYIEDSQTDVLKRYFMLQLTYTLRSFKQ
ncbi:MAG: TonB-dependent receptor [Sphingobacteriales bacterium]|nr:MAG: TonB-dependent receptor [Sphingobacteriales bacterium]